MIKKRLQKFYNWIGLANVEDIKKIDEQLTLLIANQTSQQNEMNAKFTHLLEVLENKYDLLHEWVDEKNGENKDLVEERASQLNSLLLDTIKETKEIWFLLVIHCNS